MSYTERVIGAKRLEQLCYMITKKLVVVQELLWQEAVLQVELEVLARIKV